jgi:hypothetical protein
MFSPWMTCKSCVKCVTLYIYVCMYGACCFGCVYVYVMGHVALGVCVCVNRPKSPHTHTRYIEHVAVSVAVLLALSRFLCVFVLP